MEQQQPDSVRRSFTGEFKADAVSMVLDDGRRIVDVAEALGIGDGTLGNWVLCRCRHNTQLPKVPSLIPRSRAT
jgi:transposase-like protein